MKEEQIIQKIVKETTKEAVQETLAGLGFKVDEPHEIQADLIYLNKMRKGSEEMSRWIKRSVVTVTIPTFLYLLWQAFKGALLK